MKYFLLFLLLASGLAYGQGTKTWEVPSFTITFERPLNASNNATSVWYADGAEGSTEKVFSSGGPGSGTRTYTHAYAAESTAATVNSMRLVVYCLLTNGGRHPVGWYQARLVGSTDPIKSGPFQDGVPVDSNGDPVDENGDPETPPADRHFAKAEYHNYHEYPVTVQYIYVGQTEGIILIGQGNCEPGAKFVKSGYNHEPFTISLTAFADGAQVDDTITEPSDPVVEGDPEHPEQPNPGQPGGPGGPVLPGGGQRPGGNQIPEEPAVPNEPRPGEGEPNNEARHKEIRGELQRIAAGINRVGNQAADDADRANGLLGGLKESADGIGDGIDGLGEGIDGVKDAIEGLGEGEEPGEGPGGLTLPGTGGGTEPGEYDGGGWGDRLGNIRTGVAHVISSGEGMIGALGLGQSPGSASLAWQIPVPPFGNVTLDLDAMLGEWVSVLRAFLLFILSWTWVVAVIGKIENLFSN